LKRKTLVKSLVKRIGERRQIDFILYIGEEAMNEHAFEYLNQQKRPNVRSSISNYISDDAKIYTCTIGLKSTNANYYLESAEITFNLKKLRQETVHRTVRPDGRRVQS
jgi:trehalose-6-phosphatase